MRHRVTNWQRFCRNLAVFCLRLSRGDWEVRIYGKRVR